MNQTVTEIMLALGLDGSMVGTACMDGVIRPDLADEYPSQEVRFNWASWLKRWDAQQTAICPTADLALIT